MEVIGQQRPGKAFSARFNEKFGKALQEQAAIIVIDENIPALDSTNDNMLEQIGNIYASCAWHTRTISDEIELVN